MLRQNQNIFENHEILSKPYEAIMGVPNQVEVISIPILDMTLPLKQVQTKKRQINNIFHHA